MMYKQVIIDKYEVYDAELDVIDERMQLLDEDTEEIEDLDSYNLEERFENMFSPDLFLEGSNHVIKVEIYQEDDELVYEEVFRSPYQG